MTLGDRDRADDEQIRRVSARELRRPLTGGGRIHRRAENRIGGFKDDAHARSRRRMQADHAIRGGLGRHDDARRLAERAPDGLGIVEAFDRAFEAL